MPTYQNRKCTLCAAQIETIDYKNVRLMKKFISKYMKIVPKYYSGTCLKHQKKMAAAVKRARFMALMPYTR